MVDIKIEKQNGKYQLLYKKDQPQELRTSGESKDEKGLKITVNVPDVMDRRKAEPEIVPGNIRHPFLKTRFQLEDERGITCIEGIEIEASKEITDKETFVLRIIGTSDYRARIGGRSKDKKFCFVVENCFASLHIRDIEIKDGRTLPYLIVKNMV